MSLLKKALQSMDVEWTEGPSLPNTKVVPDFLVENICIFVADEQIQSQPKERAILEMKKWACISKGYQAIILWKSLLIEETEVYMFLCELLSGNSSFSVAPGEVADKLTILSLKAERIKKDRPIVYEMFQTVSLWEEMLGTLRPDTKKIDRAYELLYELQEINTAQWECEDKVRKENNWKAAQDARDCNTRRVAKKNEINQLFKYPIEKKLYK